MSRLADQQRVFVLRGAAAAGCLTIVLLVGACSGRAVSERTSPRRAATGSWDMDMNAAGVVPWSITGGALDEGMLLISAQRQTPSEVVTVERSPFGVAALGLPHSEVLSISLADGRCLWSTALLQAPVSVPVVSARRCLVIDGHGHAWVLDSRTGAVVWSGSGIGYPVVSEELFIDSFAFLGDESAYCAGTRFGATGPGLWSLVKVRRGAPGPQWTRSLAKQVALAYAGDTHSMFLADRSGLRLLDGRTGRDARLPVPGDPAPSRLLYSGGHLYEVGRTSIRAFAADSLRQRWVSQAVRGTAVNWSYPWVACAVSDGLLIVAARGPERLLCLDAQTGLERWVSALPAGRDCVALGAGDGLIAWATGDDADGQAALGVLSLQSGRSLLMTHVRGPVRFVSGWKGQIVIVTATSVKTLQVRPPLGSGVRH